MMPNSIPLHICYILFLDICLKCSVQQRLYHSRVLRGKSRCFHQGCHLNHQYQMLIQFQNQRVLTHNHDQRGNDIHPIFMHKQSYLCTYTLEAMHFTNYYNASEFSVRVIHPSTPYYLSIFLFLCLEDTQRFHVFAALLSFTLVFNRRIFKL